MISLRNCFGLDETKWDIVRILKKLIRKIPAKKFPDHLLDLFLVIDLKQVKDVDQDVDLTKKVRREKALNQEVNQETSNTWLKEVFVAKQREDCQEENPK